MREIEFYPKQAKKIYGWQNTKTMKPVKIKDRSFQGQWDKCWGFVDKRLIRSKKERNLDLIVSDQGRIVRIHAHELDT